MAVSSLEGRIAALEQELADLRAKVEVMESSGPWWERIAGTFQQDSVYRKAMKMGRRYRRSLRPNGPEKEG